MRVVPCPRCSATLLHPSMLGSVEVDACLRCGGLWLDQGELAQVVKEAVGSLPASSPYGARRPDGGLRCPGCSEPLATHIFLEGETGSFDVDLCSACGGIWLDQGELERIQRAGAREVLDRKPGWRGWLFQFLSQLPLEFNLPPLRFPLITALLLAANLGMMILLLAMPDPRALVDLLALHPSRVSSGQWTVSLIGHMFIHGGLVHIGLNMYFLWKIGDNVEDALGRAAYLAFYLAAGVAGGLGQTLLHWGDPGAAAGASGAISGLIAAYAVFFRNARLTWMFIVLQFKLRAPYWVLIWLGFNVVGYLARQPGIAWGTHLGGFAAGLVLAALLDGRVVGRHPRVRLLRRT